MNNKKGRYQSTSKQIIDVGNAVDSPPSFALKISPFEGGVYVMAFAPASITCSELFQLIRSTGSNDWKILRSISLNALTIATVSLTTRNINNMLLSECNMRSSKIFI